MSQVMQEPQSSFIYPKSIEVAKDNPNKRYFKIFLINNALTRTIDKFGTRFRIASVDDLDRDVDTFINRPLIPFNDKKAGKHVSPKDKGIYQHRYANKMDYISTDNKFYDDYGKAKIINVYKPDPDTLAAARVDPSKIVNYDGLCETEDPGMVALLDQHKASDEELYVSPGLVAIDSYYDKDGVKVVKQFAATHSHIVDEPAFTEPVAYIHKHICDVDGKTCYFDLLTASEEKDLFNNSKDKKDMSSNNSGDQGAGITQVGENLSDIANINSKDQNGITSKTEITDSKGNVQKVIENKNANEEGKGKENQKSKKADDKEVEKVEKVEKTEKVEKVEEDKEAPLTASQLQKILETHSNKIMEMVEAKQNEKLENQAKLTVLGKYIDSKNEELKESYDFYNTLPITSDQLARVLEDSKYNPQLNNLKNGNKRAIELTASAYNTGIKTSKNTSPNRVNDTNKSGRNEEMHYDRFHGNAGKF